MFLSQLSNSNKELFLKICVHASLANGKFHKEEENMINAYCREMNIKEGIPQCNEKLEEILADLSITASNVEKNIIVLEILGLIKADGIYDEFEKKFMENLVEKMKVKDGVLENIAGLLDIYTVVCRELYFSILR